MPRFTRKKSKDEYESEDYSWGSQEEGKSHSMWSSEIKKLLKKVGLC